MQSQLGEVGGFFVLRASGQIAADVKTMSRMVTSLNLKTNDRKYSAISVLGLTKYSRQGFSY